MEGEVQQSVNLVTTKLDISPQEENEALISIHIRDIVQHVVRRSSNGVELSTGDAEVFERPGPALAVQFATLLRPKTAQKIISYMLSGLNMKPVHRLYLVMETTADVVNMATSALRQGKTHFAMQAKISFFSEVLLDGN